MVLGVRLAAGQQKRTSTAIIQGFDHSDASVLCEPGLARTPKSSPDLVDPIAGLHVLEVKGHALDQSDEIEPGRQLLPATRSGSGTADSLH